MTENSKKFKYPIGKCKSLHRDKEGRLCDLKDQPESELIGYSFFNIQKIDDNKIYPTGEKEKVPTCLECFLVEKPMMENRMAEEKIKHPEIIPYKWFYFYNDEDEKKYPSNWWKMYEKHLAKREIWAKNKDKDNNSIREVPEYRQWQEKYKDYLNWDEK